jgi:uncharacterized protein (DUF58 family)
MAEQRSDGVRRFWNPTVRDFVGSMLLLSSAFVLAVTSTMARRNGLTSAAVALSVAALIVAGVVTVRYVPRLLRRIGIEYWGNIRYFRVTTRGAVFLFLVLLIAASTFNTGNNLLVLVLSFLLAALLVSGMVSNLVLHGLRISLNLPDAIHAGQKAVALLTVHNEKRFLPSFALILRGKGSAAEGATDFFSKERHFPYLRAGSSLTSRLECRFERRGVYPVSGFEIKTKFPFGFFYRGKELDAEGRITVYPALSDVRGLLRRFPFLQGVEYPNRRGSGTGLFNIRDYQWGDDTRFTHWKSTAKLSRPMVKEFVDERNDRLQIVLSTFLPSPSDKGLEGFERALRSVTSLAYYYRSRSQPFTFYSGELEVVLNGSKESFDTLMDYLAWVQPADHILVDRRRVGRNVVLFAAGSTISGTGAPTIDYLRL